MELSIFEVLGPVMIGPSSSHTAGVARLANIAAVIAHKPFHRVRFGLSGSLEKTCTGHGTDKALLAGVMGFGPDDERIRDANNLARVNGIEAVYEGEEMEGAHENSAHFTFYHDDGTQSDVWGSSIGGGRIKVWRIGEYDVELDVERPTLVIHHKDRTGVISEISQTLSKVRINIALMRVSRTGKGKNASTVIETDSAIPFIIQDHLREIPFVTEVVIIDVPKF